MREETGVDARASSSELGDVRYWYLRDGRRIAKPVDFFLLRLRRAGDPDDHDHEVERRPLDAARGGRARRSRYAGERGWPRCALSQIAADG